MSHPYLFNASLGLSLILPVMGLNAMLRPADHLTRLEFPAHTEPNAKKLNLALMRIWGVRNISVGALLALIWSSGDEKLMGKAMCAVTTLPITDGFVSRLLIGGGEFQHWIFPPILLALSAGLSGWFD